MALVGHQLQYCEVLRTPILNSNCERLLLKISISVTNSEAVVQKCSAKKLFLEIRKIQRRTPVPGSLFKKSCRPETLVQVFSCELCEISKNTLIHRTPLVAASANLAKDGNF